MSRDKSKANARERGNGKRPLSKQPVKLFGGIGVVKLMRKTAV